MKRPPCRHCPKRTPSPGELVVQELIQEQLGLVASSPSVKKVKFSASGAQRELCREVEPKGWRPPRLLPAVEAAENQACGCVGLL